MATVLFVSPHQDDDTLTMGVAVRDHLNAMDSSGVPVHDVHILLLTTGQNSAVRTELGLDIPTFIARRDDEFMRANRQNGVPTANLHIPASRPQDGQLTVEQAQAMVVDFLTAFPGAWVKSYSPLAATGRHVDHVTAGQAVDALYRLGSITNLRYYVEPWLRTQFAAANPTVSLVTETIADKTSVTRAYAEYTRKDAPARMSGIGGLSVGGEFTENTPPFSYYHAPELIGS